MFLEPSTGLRGVECSVRKTIAVALFFLSLILLSSGCRSLYYRLPVEGSLEQFTFFDVLIYARKSIFGPVEFADSEKTAGITKEFEPRPHDTAISISMVGDIMINRRLLDTTSILYEHLPQEFFDADIRFGNLEFPVHTERPLRGFPRFNGTVDYFDKVVIPLELNVVNVANNHCLDQGIDGLWSTVELLDGHGINVVGIELDGTRFITIEISDLVIAVSGYTFSTNGVFVEGDYVVNRAQLNSRNLEEPWLDELIELIHLMKEAADIVIISLHWGFELEMFPRKSQVEIAHTLADHGVNLIIGHHPHVLQPIEVYETKDGKLATIIYSLGNWTTNMRHEARRTTAAVKVMVDSSGQITELEEYPLYLDLKKGQFVPVD